MSPPLRPYQVDAVAAAERELADVGATLIEAATGTGKTTTFAEVVFDHLLAGGKRVLVLAHRHELLNQAAARLQERLGPDITIARHPRMWPVSRVVVASVQTMARRLDRIPADAFDLVVVDECHHAVSPSYLAVLGHFRAARRLGVTATSDRADGVSLALAFPTCASRYGIADAVRDGFLVPARGLRVEVAGMDLSQVRQKVIKNGVPVKTPVHGHGVLPPPAEGEVRDLHPGDLSRAALAPEAVDGVALPLLELAGARRSVVFCVDRRHARAVAAALNARRVGCARWLDGSMHARDRRATLEAHRAGEFQFLCNVMLLTEGYDDPEIACVAMARPTQSRVLYAQACGRGLRLGGDRKVDCLVLDFVGVSCEFDLVGPEDVLAGALVGPVATLRSHRSQPAPDPTPAPSVPRHVKFVTKAVTLIRRGAKRAARGLWRTLLGD